MWWGLWEMGVGSVGVEVGSVRDGGWGHWGMWWGLWEMGVGSVGVEVGSVRHGGGVIGECGGVCGRWE